MDWASTIITREVKVHKHLSEEEQLNLALHWRSVIPFILIQHIHRYKNHSNYA